MLCTFPCPEVTGAPLETRKHVKVGTFTFTISHVCWFHVQCTCCHNAVSMYTYLYILYTNLYILYIDFLIYSYGFQAGPRVLFFMYYSCIFLMSCSLCENLPLYLSLFLYNVDLKKYIHVISPLYQYS